MELLYVWIDKYRNIERQGFNFSPKYRFEFETEMPGDENGIRGRLLISRRSDVIEEFFPARLRYEVAGRPESASEISNITAIIGENGTGKSNLLEFLVECYAYSRDSWTQPFLFVYQERETIKVLRHQSIEITIATQDAALQHEITVFFDRELVEPGDTGTRPIAPGKCIYYSNHFDGELKPFQLEDNFEYFELSTNSTLSRITHNFARNEKDPSNVLAAYRQRNAQFQIRFTAWVHTIPFIEFALPDFLEIHFSSEYDAEYVIRKLHSEDRNSEIEDTLRRLQDKLDLPGVSNQMVFRMFFAILAEKSSTMGNINEFREGYNQIIEQAGQPARENLFKIPFFFDEDRTRLSNFFADFENRFAQFEQEDGSIQVPRDQLDQLGKLSSHFEILNLLRVNPIRYDWKFKDASTHGRLSSGQKALLNLFGRLFTLHTEAHGPTLLLIDEADIGYHPEWQRRFLDQLLQVLPYMLPGASKIQIVLTSHSPFIASDLPRDNIIFLEKDDNGKCVVADGMQEMKQTFGANIHTLLSDSFFMKNGLIGEYARKKIDAVIKYLNGEESNSFRSLDHVKQYVQIIGEPIIRRQLQKMIDSKRLGELREKVDRVDEIDGLKETITLLEERLAQLEGGGDG